MRAVWHDYRIKVQMPHLAPGEKLSEVEFLKILAACQWESIARELRCPASKIVNTDRERLYGSVLDVNLRFGEEHGLEVLGEDVEIHIRNVVRFYANRFVEGLFVIDDHEISDAQLDAIKTREDLEAQPGSWACMTNAFIARGGGGNLKLKVFEPAAAADAEIEELGEPPAGIRDQARVQSTGRVDPVDGWDRGVVLEPVSREPIWYPILPESDLNGASLVYFARYESMMNYGERIFLCERLAQPISSELVSFLSTEHRRVYFFANANPVDRVLVRVEARLLPPGTFHARQIPRYRVPLQMVFRTDLYRGSDNVLMASSLVRKSLNVPGNAKGTLAECSRLLAALAPGEA